MNDPYKEGEEAAQSGSQADCPYDLGSMERQLWYSGYCNAKLATLNKLRRERHRPAPAQLVMFPVRRVEA